MKIGVGRNFDSFIEVVSGLSEGDQVVTNGQINLTGSSKVTVIK
jgi:multidrug efflux pump subunit AcrA (membrane-fusion protein)